MQGLEGRAEREANEEIGGKKPRKNHDRASTWGIGKCTREECEKKKKVVCSTNPGITGAIKGKGLKGELHGGKCVSGNGFGGGRETGAGDLIKEGARGTGEGDVEKEKRGGTRRGRRRE